MVDDPGADWDRWRAMAEAAAGRSMAALGSTTADGLPIAPLYPRPTNSPPQPWRSGADWAVSQRVDHPDPARANDLALVDLEGGADALTLVFAGAAAARGFGLAADRGAIEAALHRVELDFIGLRIDAGPPAAIRALMEIVRERGLSGAALRIDLGHDPLGEAARTGQPADLASLADCAEAARDGGFAGCALLADGRPTHEAGAGEAQELAAVLATTVAYLRSLSAAGVSLGAARDTIAVLLAVDADLLLGLAKVRAMRRLWARVENACRLDPRPLRLHAETSWRCMTRRDPTSNVMRATVGVVAAGLGGADTITVLPMTLPQGLPDAAARRLARNTGRIPIDEAHLARVDDPAGGSGAIEALTAELCERAWDLFQQIEAAGGLPAASGLLRARIAATARDRAATVACLARAIVGTSHFPCPDAPVIGILDVPPRPFVVAGPDALSCQRDAEPFEALRDRAEAFAGQPPAVFVALLGPSSSYGPRATFAANLFATAGIVTPQPEPLPIETLAAGFRASGCAVACLCGSDEAYRIHGERVVALLREAGATLVLMAGSDDHLRTMGVDALVHDSCNALDLLALVLDHAGR